MKKLLTKKEMFENKGEPRGKIKEVRCDWVSETDYKILEIIFKELGLDEYIQMVYLLGDEVSMRIFEEEEL